MRIEKITPRGVLCFHSGSGLQSRHEFRRVAGSRVIRKLVDHGLQRFPRFVGHLQFDKTATGFEMSQSLPFGIGIAERAIVLGDGNVKVGQVVPIEDYVLGINFSPAYAQRKPKLGLSHAMSRP